MLRMMKLSGSGMLQAFIGMASWIVMVRVLADFGSNAVAGYTIGMRVVLFALFPAFGLANAAATMVGQSLGGLQPKAPQKAVVRAGLDNAIFLSGMGILFLLGTADHHRLVFPDPAVDRYAVACLRTPSPAAFPCTPSGWC